MPVCPAHTAESLRKEVEELICLEAPSDPIAISLWYRNFKQTSDEEVIELLESARREQQQQEEERRTNDPDRRT